jgi:hypothetical protein
MASRPPTPHAGSGSASMSPAEFEQALREATASTQSHGFGPRAAPIPDLRRAVGRGVRRGEFDQGLRRLQEEGSIGLEPHAHPEFLSPFEVQDALPEGPSLLYLLRWLK